MTNQLWSWTLGGLGAVVVWLAGTTPTRLVAWLVGLGLQALWLTYALVTAQYGFLVSCAVFAVVYARNLRRELRSRATLVRDQPRDPRGES